MADDSQWSFADVPSTGTPDDEWSFADASPQPVAVAPPAQAGPTRHDQGLGVQGRSRPPVPVGQTGGDVLKQLATTPAMPFSRLAPEHPTTALGGAVKGGLEFAEGLTSPENLALQFSTGGLGDIARALPMAKTIASLLPRAISTYFGAQLLIDAVKTVPAVKQAWDASDTATAAKEITKAVLGGTLGGAALGHAVRSTSADIGSAIEQHNIGAEQGVAAEANQETPVSGVAGPGDIVQGVSRPMAVRPHTINPDGTIKTHEVIDPDTGEVLFAGKPTDVQTFISRFAVKPVEAGAEPAEQPEPETPPTTPSDGWSFADTNKSSAPSDQPAGTSFEKAAGKFTVQKSENGKVTFDFEGPTGAYTKTLPVATFDKMMSTGPVQVGQAENKEDAPATSESEVIQPKPSAQPEAAGAEEVQGDQGGNNRSERPGEVRSSEGGPAAALPVSAGAEPEPVRGLPPEVGGEHGGTEPEPVAGGPGKDSGATGIEKSTVDEQKPSYSSTQVNLPAEYHKYFKAATEGIADKDLAEDGRETEAHATVSYGLHDENPEVLKPLLAEQGPIKATIGKISIFPASESGGSDVVKLDVTSPDLEALNKKVAALPHTDTHPQYSPHITLAYVKAGEGQKYVGKEVPGLTGKEITFNDLTFSGKDESKTTIPLKSEPDDGWSLAEPEKSNVGETKPATPVTPQVPSRSGTRYVVPSFATAGAAKTPSAGKYPNLDGFIKVYEKNLRQVVEKNPGEYSWPISEVPAVAERMRKAIIGNSYSHQGKAFVATAKELGIKPTRKAIEEYLSKAPDSEESKRAPTNLGAKVTPQVMSGVGPAVSEDVKVHDRIHNEWDAEPDWYQDTPAPRPPWTEVVDAYADYSAANTGKRVQHIKDFAADFAEDKGDAHWYRMPEPPLAKPEETPKIEAGNERAAPVESVRSAGNQPLEEQLPQGSESPGGSESTPPSSGKSRGVRKPRKRAGASEGSELEPSRGTVSGVVGDPAEPERTFPPRAEAVSSANHEHDYRIPDGRVVSGSPEARAKTNIEAIKTLQQIQSENRPATVQEQGILAGYVGWGAVPQIFAGKADFEGLQTELKSLLSLEEYEDAQRSTTNAHYTGDNVVDAMWKAVQHLGATPGMSWLEPAVGVGNFFGRQPSTLLQGARRVGLDKDSVSGQIAKLLYPDSGIDVVAFEDAELPKDYFDGAISNVPFGNFGVHDPEFRGKGFLTGSIHNYFFAKSLTHVRPGGVVAFVTSRYTMDAYEKPALDFRKWVSSQADFIGAVRLPAGAFRQSSGTEVITDIIFLRRRAPGEAPAGDHWETSDRKMLKTSDYPYNVPHSVNQYYHAHPDMILGKEGISRGQFSSTDYNVEGKLTQANLDKALERLPSNLGFQAKSSGEKRSRRVASRELNAPAEQSKLGGLFFDDKGDLYRKTSKGSAEPIDVAGPAKKRIKGQLAIRDALVRLTTAELAGKPDNELDVLRRALNLAYDHFVKVNGPLSSQANTASMKGDPDAPLLVSLERRFDKGNKSQGRNPSAEKAPIFSRRMLKPAEVATSVGEPKEALYISLNEKGRIDWDRMGELTGRTPEQLQKDLSGLVYQDPQTEIWQTAEEYLSGSVRNKLKQARAISKVDPRYKENAEALEKVQPEDIAPGDIRALLGVTWVPIDRYSEFAAEMLGAENPEKVKVKYAGGNWIVDTGWGNRLNNGPKWSTARAGAVEILNDSLNMRRTKILDRASDGSTSVNPDETKSARAKQMEMQEHFEQWLFAENKRADEIARIYNDTQNDLRLRTFDGSHLTLPGMTKDAAVVRGGDLDPHQKAAVWRQIVQPNVLLAHAVGAGKAQPLDAKVLTPGGWERMGDIQIGDHVIAGDGSPTRVEAIFPQGDKEIFRVEFSDGSSTETCDEHLWLTHTYKERSGSQASKKLGKDWGFCKPKVRPLSEIRKTLKSAHLGAKNHSIPMVESIQFTARPVQLDPYLLGVLLGDGCFRGAGTLSFSTADEELISNVKAVLPEGCEVRHRSGYDYAICQTVGIRWASGTTGRWVASHPVVNPLKSLGLYGKYSHEKHVPEEYLFNASEVRLALLRGLMDTDGSVSKRGTGTTFCSTSKALIDAVTFLVESFGGTVSTRKKNPRFTHKGVLRFGREASELHICLPPEVNPFRLSRKASLVRPKSKYRPIRYITEVVSVGRKLAQCIRVAHPSHLYVTDRFIVTHNTFEMIAAGMELKRLGLVSRPMYVVPNATLTGWQTQFAALYPNKRIIVFSEKDLEKSKRQQIMAQIATGDWDAVVVPHSSFQFLPTGDEVFEQHFEKLSSELQEAIDESNVAGIDTRQIKRMEKAKERLLTSLKDKRAADKKDQTVTWEQLGIDQLFVDESHEYKKLGFSTKQGNVAGIDQQGNQKTFDLLMKMRHTQDHGRGVVFATGTPVTNTMGELYTVMKYLIEKELDARGIGKFDEWAANFGRTVDVFEPKVEGGGYQMKARFAQFVNIPELAQLFRSFADVVTSDMIDIPRPEIVGGKRQAVETQLTDEQDDFLQELRQRAKGIRDDPRGSLPDNMLAVYGDAAKMAMDIRMVRPEAPDDPNGRLNVAADKIHQLWEESTPVKGTQLVMSDLGKPAEAGGSKDFSAYDELIRKLVERGIPRNEIAHIYQAKNKSQRARLFQDVNDGKIRVLLGSTMKMGVGVNVQQRLFGMHHLDVPHRPSDLEQREGRILRQGNENPKVHIYYYVTKGSLDEAKFSNVVRKAKFINQVMQGKSTVREAEDVGGMIPSLEMFQAMASGDPRVMQKMETDAEVDRLSGVFSGWKNQQYKIRGELSQIPQRIKWANNSIDNIKQDMATRDKAGDVWTVGKQKFSGEKIGKEVSEAIRKEVNKAIAKKAVDVEVGTGFGLPILVSAPHEGLVKVELGNTASFVMNQDEVESADLYRRIKNQAEGFEEAIASKQNIIEKAKKEQKNLESSIEDKWPYAEKLKELAEKQQTLVKELGADKGDDAAMAAGEGAEISDKSVEAQEADEPEEEGGEEDEEESPIGQRPEKSGERGGAPLDFLTLGAAKLIEKDIIPTLANAAKGIAHAKNDIQRVVAPASREGAKDTALTIREHAAELARATDRAEAALDTARKFFETEPAQSNLDFIDRIENGQPQPNGAAQTIASTMRQILDDRRQRVQDLGTGKLEEYYEDYFPHIWKDPAKATDAFKAWFGKRPMEGGKSFLKKRTIPTIKDGIDMGLEPESTNPVDLILAKVREMDKYIFAHRALNELKDTGVLKFVRAGTSAPDGYAKINDNIAVVYGPRTEEGAQTIRGQYYAPEPAATILNNYLSPGLRKYGSFRAYMGLANTLNQFQLGWSAYHLGFTSMEAAISRTALGIMQMGRGDVLKGLGTVASSPIAPFRGLWEGDKVLKEWFKPGSQGQELGLIVDAMMMAGGRARMDKFYQTSTTKRMMEAFRQGNIWGGVLRAPFALTEQASRPILEWAVPRQKMAVFADLARLEMEKIGTADPAKYREAMARAWDSVDNRMGQLVYDNLFWNKAVKDLAMASVRSVGWNMGTIREILGGGADTVKALGDGLRGKPPEVTSRMAYILALPLVAGLLGGIIHYLSTGQRPDELKDYFFPRRGAPGTPGWKKRMALPTYVKDVVHYGHDPYGTIKGKLHPLLETIMEMLSNEDYFGRHIMNHKDPLVKQMEDMAKHVGETLEPLAMRPLLAPQKQAKEETTAEKVLPFVGVTEAPKYVTNESK